MLAAHALYGQTNYIEYHKEARSIESDILDSSCQEAVQGYKSLLSKYEFVYAEDCFRAAQTAVFAADIPNAFLFLERAVMQGITKDCIAQDSLLTGLSRAKYWSTFESRYDSLRSIYTSRINWQLREKINELNDLDQKYRDKHELHPWNFLWRPFIWLKWKKITQEIVEKELIPLIREYGFPNERQIGVDEATFHHKRKKDGIKSSFAFMILIHYFSVPRTAEYNELLFAEIEKGNMHPRQYASLIDFQVTNGKNKYYKGLRYNEWGISKDSSEFDQINQNREDIGLESMETRSQIFKRAIAIGKQRQEGNYKHIRFWVFSG